MFILSRVCPVSVNGHSYPLQQQSREDFSFTPMKKARYNDLSTISLVFLKAR